jgi:hypothetical protein
VMRVVGQVEAYGPASPVLGALSPDPLRTRPVLGTHSASVWEWPALVVVAWAVACCRQPTGGAWRKVD